MYKYILFTLLAVFNCLSISAETIKTVRTTYRSGSQSSSENTAFIWEITPTKITKTSEAGITSSIPVRAYSVDTLSNGTIRQQFKVTLYKNPGTIYVLTPQPVEGKRITIREVGKLRQIEMSTSYESNPQHSSPTNFYTKYHCTIYHDIKKETDLDERQGSIAIGNNVVMIDDSKELGNIHALMIVKEFEPTIKNDVTGFSYLAKTVNNGLEEIYLITIIKRNDADASAFKVTRVINDEPVITECYYTESFR